jgi:hypothetical protein
LYQYTTYSLRDLGAGIDQQSAENQIKEGYCEVLLNADPEAMGYISKRLGYQRHAGQLPVRITKVVYQAGTTNNLCFFLDSEINISSVNLLTTRRTPIIISGRTSSQNTENAGSFPNNQDTILYYPTFDSSVEQSFPIGANTIQSDGVSSPDVFVHTTKKLNAVDTSNEVFLADETRIDTGTGAVEIDVVNSTGSAFDGYVYLSAKPALGGTTYVSSPTTIATGPSTVTIPTATHQLSNFNIDTRVYITDSGEYTEVDVDEVEIAANGDVSFTFNNNTASTFDVVIYITAYPIANTKFGTIAAGATQTIEIDSLSTDFIGLVCYLEPTFGGPKQKVYPNSIIVDSTTKTATVEFVNNTADAANFYLYWEEIEITSNRLCVNADEIDPGDVFTDTRPQMTLWGLDHRTLYSSTADSLKPGWVNHIDSYRSEADSRLVSGLGGNVFTESTDRTNYLMPTLYPDLRGRVQTNTNLGPAFYTTGATPVRTRGYITADTVDAAGRIRVSSIEWQSGIQVKYTLNDPTLSRSGPLSGIISATAGLEDYITVSNSSNPRHSGTFKVVSATDLGGGLYEIIAENSAVKCADFDELNTSAKLGVFTDRLTLLASSRFLVGDGISSDLFALTAGYTISSTEGATIVLRGLTAPLLVPSGLRLAAKRTGRILPMRDLDDNATVENLVVGDSLTSSSLLRKLTIERVNPDADDTISVTSTGGVATVTLSATTTTKFSVGQSVLIRQCGDYSGEQVITNILSDTEFEFATTVTGSDSGILVGKCVQLDETLEIQDTVNSSIFYTVSSRWIPIEAPDDSFTLTPSTYVQHMDSNPYANQLPLKSTMSADTLYMTNGQDEVMKYDGSNIYRAGLFRWQPQLFITTTTSPSATITGTINHDELYADVTAVDGTKYTVEPGEQKQFPIGSKIQDSTGEKYTIVDTDSDATNGYVIVNNTITGSPSSISSVAVLRYYFRLNAVDANNNLIASAVTGSFDTLVEISGNTQVRIRMVGLPAWHIYDYDRLEVEVYRTEVDKPPPYYKLATIPMSFNETDAYIDWTDTKDDELLRDFDPVVGSLFGSELATQLAEPMRAKYVTSSANSLVLANLRDYPEIAIQYFGQLITASQLSGSEFMFRRDNTDIGTTSNLTDRQRYEFVTSGAITVVGFTNNSDTSATVEVADTTGLSAGQWIYLFHAANTGERSLQYSGWFRIDSVDSGTEFTVLHTHTEAGYTPDSTDANRMVVASAALDIPVWLGTDGNYEQSTFNPSGEYSEIAMIRLANAINCSMRLTSSPWIIANAGGEYNVGQLVVRQPRADTSVFEVQLPDLTGATYSLFANNIRRTSEEQVSAFTRLYPSRVIISESNYPELFDNPRAQIDSQSRSAVDVNAADGQEITGIIPFFGESAFGSAQKDGIVVVFKENSIYLLNIAAKRAGQQPVQKIESQGLGCTAPASIAVTKDGVMFANRSGIYKLTSNLTVEYVGQKVERLWESDVNLDQLDECVGHHYSIGKQYKLSYPRQLEQENSRAFVYNHTREYQGQQMGAWGQYTNHPATGWANLFSDAYFASTNGIVYQIRNTGTRFDFRDDTAGIEMDVVLQATDFGDAGIRKIVSAITTHFRNTADMEGTQMYSAMDLESSFDELDSFKIVNESDKVVTVQFSIGRKKGVYFQVRMTNSTKDEPVELTSIDIRVAGLNDKGILQAANTTS